MLYERTILKAVLQSVDEYPITLITGARQVGKTTLVSYFERNKNYKYLSFDDSDLLKEANENPKAFLKKYGYPLILDEVQYAKNIFFEIEHIVNEVKRLKGSQAANGMYILTGSQKFNLMKEVSESMSGRVDIIEMAPLSQVEIKKWDNRQFEIDNERMHELCDTRFLNDDDLYNSIVRGFYPARWEIEGKPIKDYYSNYVKTYIDRDVFQLINIKDRQKFEDLLKVLASITGKDYIPDSIAKTLGISKNTVESWVSIAITGDIIRLLPPYFEDSMNKRIVKRKKVYFNDTGLACFLLGIDSSKSLKLSSFKGFMVETYIHNEIRKSFINNGINPEMFYYRDSNQNEIDLIIKMDGKLDLVECKSGKNFAINSVKGFKQLDGTAYEINGRCIICTTDEPYRIASGIYAFPIRCI